MSLIDLVKEVNNPNEGASSNAVSPNSSAVKIPKRESNGTLACNKDLCRRIRIMAAARGVSMQSLVEKWIEKELKSAGF